MVKGKHFIDQQKNPHYFTLTYFPSLFSGTHKIFHLSLRHCCSWSLSLSLLFCGYIMGVDPLDSLLEDESIDSQFEIESTSSRVHQSQKEYQEENRERVK